MYSSICLIMSTRPINGHLQHQLCGVRQVLVEKLKWMTSTVFLELLALCQVMPGPTSTQMSFAIGVTQQGVTGGLLSGKSSTGALLPSKTSGGPLSDKSSTEGSLVRQVSWGCVVRQEGSQVLVSMEGMTGGLALDRT